MADRGTRYTDAQYRATRDRLREIYAEAERDLSRKLGDFQRAHQARDEKYRAMVEEGTMSKEDYNAWLRGQAFQSRQFEDALANIVNDMTNIDKRALDIVDGTKRDIFCANANYLGYDLEHSAGIDLGFGLYDAATVTRIVRNQPDLLRPLSQRKINEGKEIPYYQQAVRNSITQGIIQGESVEEICHRITSTCRQRGESAAMRDARTAYTGAQNAGRIAGMRQAEELGIEVRKRWIATLDDKTRDAHQDLDGQTQKVDDPFIVDGDEIMYPGDPHAKAGLVYNCRCTLGWIYPKYQTQINRRDNETGEDVGAMTYREWAEAKAGQENAAEEARRSDDNTQQQTMGDVVSQDDDTSTAVDEVSLHNALADAYEYHRIKHDLRTLPYDPDSERQFIVNDLSQLGDKSKQTIETTLTALSGKYDTTLIEVRTATAREALEQPPGWYAVTGLNYHTDSATMILNAEICRDENQLIERIGRGVENGYFARVPESEYARYLYVHEFAHTLLNTADHLDSKTNYMNVDLDTVREIRRQVGRVYSEYREEVGRLQTQLHDAGVAFEESFDMEAYETGRQASLALSRITLSKYSLTNADEFFAESFVYTELGGTDNQYAMRIRAIIDEHFRR